MNPWLRIIAPAIGVILLISAGYYQGKKIERSAWLERENVALREVQDALETERTRLQEANERVEDLQRQYTEERDESERLAREVEGLLAREPTVRVVEQECESGDPVTLLVPDIRADWWLHNCALSAAHCQGLPATDEALGSDDALPGTDLVRPLGEGAGLAE